ncbi:MAG: MFS transporter [Chloroflexota bacterium]
MWLLEWLSKPSSDSVTVARVPADNGAAVAASASKSLPLGLSQAFNSLSIPQFRVLWFGMFFSMSAMQINIVARSWLAYDISGSGLMLGVVALARGLPQIIMSPFGGVAADRFDKRKLLILSQSSLCFLALLNAVLVNLGIIQIWHLVVIGLLQGMVFPFTMPTRQAYIPELVGEAQLPNALAVDSSGRNLNRVLAPSLAGLLIAWHPTIAFYAIAILYLGAVLTLYRLPAPRMTDASHSSAVEAMTAGFRYIISHRKLLSLIAIGFLTVIFGMPFQELLPVFQATVLRVGPAELGFMYTAAGIGALAGSLAVAFRSDHPRKGLLQVISGVGFGVMLIPFAISSTYWLSLVLLVLVGFTSQASLTFNRMLVLIDTDRNMYGRVMGIYMMTWSLMPIATLPMGALVDAVGAPLTIAVAGGLLAVSIIALALVLPALWRK